MAYPMVAARPPRPASVVVGVAFLVTIVIAQFVLAVAQFLIVGPVGSAIEAVEAADPQQEGLGTAFAAVLFGGGGALNALSAVVLAVLAGFDAAGKQPARVMTWILAPLAALCCGCPSAIYSEFVFQAAGSSPPASPQEFTPEQMAAIADGMPAWYTPVVIAAVGLMCIGVLGTIIAFAVPGANEYFRKPVQMWVPSYDPYQQGYPQQPYPPQLPPTQPPTQPPNWPPQ